MSNERDRQPDNRLKDRLFDRALREAAGGERPPDLSDKIIAAAEAEGLFDTPHQKKERAMSAPKRYGFLTKGQWAVAATLLVAACGLVLILPHVQPTRDYTRATAMSKDAAAGDDKQVAQQSPTGEEAGAALSGPGREYKQTSLEVSRSKLQDGEMATPPPVMNEPLPAEQAAPAQSPPIAMKEKGEKSSGFNFASPQPVPAQRGQKQSNGVGQSIRSGGNLQKKPAGGRRGAAGGLGQTTNKRQNALLERQKALLEELRRRGGDGRFGQATGNQQNALVEELRRVGKRLNQVTGKQQNAGGMGGGAMMPSGGQRSQRLALLPRGPGGPGLPAPPPGAPGAMPGQPPMPPGEGQGPGRGGDQYARIHDNPFRTVKEHPLSTFSIDVDTASYANVRGFLMQANRLPPPDAVRIEEMVNYFDYAYDGPTDAAPFAAHVEVAGCPWKPEHRLVRVALKGREIDRDERETSNLVFLLDVSGSMRRYNKLPLVKRGMEMLAKQLGENDRVAIVVYAGSEGLVLPSTLGGEQQKIIAALKRLEAGGSTNGGAGIKLAYEIAQKNFIEGGVNRVILCTDGDFNVGTTSSGELERLVVEKAKSGVFLSVLGFGRGNLNDAMMEAISNKGNGNYGYVDNDAEARKILVEQMSGTLVTIAKDVKIQIEFNPAEVAGYRLIGYENRILAKEDFNDDKKDAGEIGAGHAVTALYEIVPAGKPVPSAKVDALKYQKPVEPTDAAESGELLTLKLRYKAPDGEKSKLLEFPVADDGQSFAKASEDFKFASAVAAFGMLLRGSEHAGNATYDAVLEIATEGKGDDRFGYRAEFLDMVRRAKQLDAQ